MRKKDELFSDAVTVLEVMESLVKIANTPEGTTVEANENAPNTAVCPYCKGTLTLRSRRAMNNGQRSYFWRHGRNQNHDCQGRRRPV